MNKLLVGINKLYGKIYGPYINIQTVYFLDVDVLRFPAVVQDERCKNGPCSWPRSCQLEDDESRS